MFLLVFVFVFVFMFASVCVCVCPRLFFCGNPLLQRARGDYGTATTGPCRKTYGAHVDIPENNGAHHSWYPERRL